MTLDMQETLLAITKMFDHPHQWYGGRTYAQHGDDLAIINLFNCLRIQQPSWLDIGAHHPFHLSNTALLYQRGSRGINVEANPALMEAFKLHRPEDKNVCVAVVASRHRSARLHRVGNSNDSGDLRGGCIAERGRLRGTSQPDGQARVCRSFVLRQQHAVRSR